MDLSGKITREVLLGILLVAGCRDGARKMPAVDPDISLAEMHSAPPLILPEDFLALEIRADKKTRIAGLDYADNLSSILDAMVAHIKNSSCEAVQYRETPEHGKTSDMEAYLFVDRKISCSYLHLLLSIIDMANVGKIYFCVKTPGGIGAFCIDDARPSHARTQTSGLVWDDTPRIVIHLELSLPDCVLVKAGDVLMPPPILGNYSEKDYKRLSDDIAKMVRKSSETYRRPPIIVVECSESIRFQFVAAAFEGIILAGCGNEMRFRYRYGFLPIREQW